MRGVGGSKAITLVSAAFVLVCASVLAADARAPARSPVPPARPAPATVADVAVPAAPVAPVVAQAPSAAPPAPAAVPQTASAPRIAASVPGVARSPLPRPRPGGRAAPVAVPQPAPAPLIAPEVEAAVAAALAAPQPSAAARAISPLAPVTSPRPPRRNPAAIARARAPAAAATPAVAARPSGPVGGGLCGVRGIEGRQLARISSTVSGCGIAEPVSITRVNGIPLTQAATVDCDTARAFERWLREAAVPAMQRHGGGIARVRVAAHYACRTRNNRPGARISEHGRGRAIDISGFTLANGETVHVLRNFRSGPYARALQQMHRGACGIFRTTLGPGSDRFHEDHFHYDLARHRGGGTYCR